MLPRGIYSRSGYHIKVNEVIKTSPDHFQFPDYIWNNKRIGHLVTGPNISVEKPDGRHIKNYVDRKDVSNWNYFEISNDFLRNRNQLA